MMKQDYYIYLHRRKSDNKVFYVGKGRKYRAGSRSGRNSRWVNTYKKHGLIVELVFENLTEDEAFELEIDTIKEMRYHFGSTMCNMTDGGEGVSGYKWEDMSKHPSKGNIGRKQSKEAIERRVAAMIGHTVPQETRDKIAVSNRKTKAPEVVFSRIKRTLLGKCLLTSRDFDRLPDINRLEFYIEPNATGIGWSKTAIRKSVEARKGKPAHNGDKTIYSFVNIYTNEQFTGTRRDLAMLIGAENLQHVIKHVARVVLGKRVSVRGWKLLKENNGTI